MKPQGTDAYRKINELGRNGLSHVLSEASYADHVHGMLAEVRRQSPGTRVALVTIPPITEDLNAKINDSVRPLVFCCLLLSRTKLRNPCAFRGRLVRHMIL